MRLRTLIAALIFLATPALADYSSLILADTPRHYYHMNASSGTSESDVGTATAENMVYNGTFTLSQGGITGYPGNNAVAFSGTDDTTFGKINEATQAHWKPETTNGGGWSSELWIKASSLQTAIVVANGGITGAFNWFIATIVGGSFQINIYGGPTACLGGNYANSGNVGSFTTGVYHHLVLTTVGAGSSTLSSVKFYTDATLQANLSSFSGTVCGAAGQVLFAASSPGTGTDLAFNGLIDEPAVYGAELTQAQVTAHFNCGSAGTCGSAAARRRVIQSRLELPRFQDDDYFERVAALGYNTGLLAPNVREPQLLRAAFTAPYSVMPNGRGKGSRPQRWNGTPFERRARELGLLKKAA